jgi:hypothetical protein
MSVHSCNAIHIFIGGISVSMLVEFLSIPRIPEMLNPLNRIATPKRRRNQSTPDADFFLS